MEKVEKIIDTLRIKIEQLVEENRKLKKEVSGLVDQTGHYKALSEETQKTLTELESRSQATMAAEHLRDGAGPEKARERIDELVREIDRCINLLSR